MDSFIFAFEAVAPIIILVAVGYFLKKSGWIEAEFAKKVNKLVFHFFLPAMLFLNVYKISNPKEMNFSFAVYALCGVVLIFIISLPLVMAVTKDSSKRGPLLQATFRSNYALVGIPLSEMLYGEEGIMLATLLSAVIVPLYNILGVISLSAFTGGRFNVKKVFIGILKNPLIRSIAAGVVALALRALFVKYNVDFRLTDIKPVFTALEYLGRLATPLALLALGAQFDFSSVPALRREIIFGTLMRVFIAPACVIGFAYIFFRECFGGAQFAVLIIAFTTPVAVSSVPMTQEMGGDHQLAGQLVVWTTLFSALSVFFASFILKAAGVL